MTTLYFFYPFGVSADDLEEIPMAPPTDGSVNYENGWTPPYELNLLTNPAALPIPRGQMNQLFFDITSNIQQYQQYGTPAFITTMDNLGNPFPYPIYARVYYSGQVYENQVVGNIVLPGTDNSWRLVSGSADGVPIGGFIDFAGVVAPTNYFACDGSAKSRTTYAPLFQVITFIQTGTLTNGANTVSGLSSTANMYVGMPVEGTNIPGGTTVASIVDSTDITLSANATGSGATSMTFFPWGDGDGSTTFNLPDFRRRTAVGSGGAGTTVLGSAVGQVGGEESHLQALNEMASHTHTVTTPLSATGGTAQSAIQGNTPSSSTADSVSTVPPSQVAFNIMQKSAVTLKCIKYA